ncbi:hypothetical protein [Stutzerimonas nitrititolerans]|uniref:hypothetical protein n=1 Tax=Stutzerimonas nitrititolerans TaxID=2482751 RepID=UPI001BDC10F0|nr:hypothetical protein [Stutzerimonas nitrititolerans]MBT1120766.1 hypothetical protein [Stutzerimonas nitrititolerans]
MFEGADWTTIFVALAAGVTAAAGPISLHLMDARKERAGVRAALIAEVVALAGVIRIRKYCEDLEKTAQNLSLRARASPPFSPAIEEDFRVSIPDQYNLIYRENASRLGCLKPSEAVDVVRFYQLVLAVIADMSPGGSLYEGTASADSFLENRTMLIAALALADRLARKVGLSVNQEA